MSGRKTGDGAGEPAPSARRRVEPATLAVAEQIPHAHEHALRLLSVRERSESELRTRLRTRGYHPEAILAVLDRLRDTGLQSDARFADRFASDAARRGSAGRRIQGELRARGVAKDLAAAAATVAPEEERARALDFARKRAARMAGVAPEVRARRLAGQLARRGYDAETCRSVLDEVIRLEPADADDG